MNRLISNGGTEKQIRRQKGINDIVKYTRKCVWLKSSCGRHGYLRPTAVPQEKLSTMPRTRAVALHRRRRRLLLAAQGCVRLRREAGAEPAHQRLRHLRDEVRGPAPLPQH